VKWAVARVPCTQIMKNVKIVKIPRSFPSGHIDFRCFLGVIERKKVALSLTFFQECASTKSTRKVREKGTIKVPLSLGFSRAPLAPRL
jgi:hypothetical protein